MAILATSTRGLPWEHKSSMDRIDKHEKSQRLLEKTWPAYPNDEDSGKMRHEYSLLRSTIERVIQDVVFNGVVQRYRDWIRVDKLDGAVGVTATDFKTIARLHKACCDVVDSHDPASAKNSPVPNAKQLGQDIADLKTLVDSIKSRRKGA
jgi:hypothetical protein